MATVTLDAAGWASLEAKTGASASRGRIEIPESVAENLFDPTSLAALPRRADARLVEGPDVSLSGVTRAPYSGAGVRIGDRLVMDLFTR